MDQDNVTKRAYGHFAAGYHCAEVVVKTTLELVGETDGRAAVKAAGGFGGGIVGSTEELCGAFTGAVMALSLVLGRDKPGEELRDLARAVIDLKSRFAERAGSLACGTILDGFKAQDQRVGCARLTAEAAVMVAEILEGREATEAAAPAAAAGCACGSRETVGVGRCPFSAPPA